MTDVTVIIPTRDRGRLLPLTVASALAQRDVGLEVMVVDDASTPPTAETLRAVRDPRLRILRQERHLGVAAARNAGLDRARGEWVAFLDDDDLWAPPKLHSQLDAARSTGAAFAYCGALAFDAERRKVSVERPLPSPTGLLAALVRRNVIPGGASNVLARSDAVRAVGGFDEGLHQLADWDLWLRLAKDGVAAVRDGLLVACRRHAGNMLLGEPADVRVEFDRLRDKHRDLRDGLGVDFDAVAFSHWVSEGLRRAGRRREAARVHLQAACAHRDLGHLGSAVRMPLGDRALALRERRAAELPAPAWLAEQLGWR